MTTTRSKQAEELRPLYNELEGAVSKHDLAIVLIKACLDTGIDTGPAIVTTLAELGLNSQHVGMMLSKHCAPRASESFWHKTAEGTYALHPEE